MTTAEIADRIAELDKRILMMENADHLGYERTQQLRALKDQRAELRKRLMEMSA
jgi:uncharacterized protein YdcH (DUF465 family)